MVLIDLNQVLLAGLMAQIANNKGKLDENLIRHFGVLTGTRSTLMNDRFAHRFPAGLQCVDDRLIAADHDREGGRLRARLPAARGAI